MQKWEWERLRDAYREQRDMAAARGDAAAARDYHIAYKWACEQVRTANRRMYGEMRAIAEANEA